MKARGAGCSMMGPMSPAGAERPTSPAISSGAAGAGAGAACCSKTAAILLIGNEILSGKVEDENARYLVRELRSLGVTVGRIEVVPDVLDDIAATVRALSARFDVVFTSGGVGPT